jgi:hypothetical protein
MKLNLRSVQRMLVVVAALMTCAACSPFVDRPKLQVSIPADCEQLAKQVPLPAVTMEDDVKASEARHRAALVEANKNLSATGRCQARVRARFANGG